MGETEDRLAVVFREFCSFGMGSRNVGPPLMDSRQCQKLARDCGLVDKRLTKVDIDLIFTSVKGRGEHRIDYLDFLECVRQWAEKKRMTYEELCDVIANSPGPSLNHVTTPDSTKFSSPLIETVNKTPAQQRTSPASSSVRRGTSPLSAGGPRAPASVSSVSSSRGERRGSRPPPPPPANMALHPDWYEVQNPHPAGPDEQVYYVNRKTNETRWDRPVIASPSTSVEKSSPSQALVTLEGNEFDLDEDERRGGEGNGHFTRKGSSPYKSVFDKLTDHTLYTGTHKYRFNPATGQGLGIKGRDSVGKGQGTVVTSPTAFRGNTNTGTDEVIHDLSQIINRK